MLTPQGPAELSQLCNDLHERFKGVQHWEGNVFVQAIGETLTNTSYWKAQLGGEVISLGKHEDTFRFEGGAWRFASRRIVHTWTKAGGFENPA